MGTCVRVPAAEGDEPGLVSVVIKAFNEEGKIARAIESALAAAAEIAPHRLEVVVADSCSTDGTVDVARRYPIRVVRMVHACDRGCGAGVQLGYAWARGDWVYLMDGDMSLVPGFLGEALQLLFADPSLGAVGGFVLDLNVGNSIDRIRVNNRSGGRDGDQPWLEGGGLYRRSAIDAAGGHAANRSLLAYEEAELGLRLGQAGFVLRRLARPAVSHQGHALGTWALLARHWRSRRAMSAGMLLRMSLRRPWRWRVMRMLAHPLATGLWWAALLLGWLFQPWQALLWTGMWVGASALTLLGLAVLKRDLTHACVSVVSWHYALAAIVWGWLLPMRPAHEPIEAELLAEPGMTGRAEP